jgi:hypothetical protein
MSVKNKILNVKKLTEVFGVEYREKEMRIPHAIDGRVKDLLLSVHKESQCLARKEHSKDTTFLAFVEQEVLKGSMLPDIIASYESVDSCLLEPWGALLIDAEDADVIAGFNVLEAQLISEELLSRKAPQHLDSKLKKLEVEPLELELQRLIEEKWVATSLKNALLLEHWQYVSASCSEYCHVKLPKESSEGINADHLVLKWQKMGVLSTLEGVRCYHESGNEWIAMPPSIINFDAIYLLNDRCVGAERFVEDVKTLLDSKIKHSIHMPLGEENTSAVFYNIPAELGASAMHLTNHIVDVARLMEVPHI